MTPEEAARQKIDELLTQAGWKIQDFNDLNLGAALGVVFREFPLQSGLRIIFSLSIVRQWEPLRLSPKEVL